MLMGYARVSTTDQNPDLQIDALKHAGCERIFTDTISGAKTQRPELDRLMQSLRSGDTVVVWRLDRLGRSLQHLIALVQELDQQGVGFRSLTESIDTTTSGGKLIFHIFGALAEFERNVIRERTKAGLDAARLRGRTGGRKPHPVLSNPKHLAVARKLYANQTPIEDICATLKVSRSTLFRYLSKEKVPA
jgi:DNA invertase Pin-like site-specific DNA recombinase